MTKQFWHIIRPFHAPFTRTLRKVLGSNYAEHPEMQLPAPYEAVQLDVERNLDKYLHTAKDAIRRIVVVGANTGDEVPRLRHSYTNCQIVCFEPSPKWYRTIVDRFKGATYVDCRQLAISDNVGVASFYELPMDGNGSLLEPDRVRWEKATQWQDSRVERFEVKLSTLDIEFPGDEKIDLLWVDVQGAEAGVLKGGTEVLRRTRAVFLEVALIESPYKGALLYSEIDRMLSDVGFRCVALGTDGWNFSGNALWIRNISALMYKPVVG